MQLRPDVIVIMTDEERAAPAYETAELAAWRAAALPGCEWFERNGVSFRRHYTGSLACVPSRPTMFTGQYPDVHRVTQTDGLAKGVDDSRMRWLSPTEVPTLGHWFRAAGYDTHYDGKWHMSHADLLDDAGEPLATNDAHGVVDPDAVARYLEADPLDEFGFSGWVGPEPHGGMLGNAGVRRDDLIAARVVAWLHDRYARRRAGDAKARRPFLLVASFVNPHDIVLYPMWAARGTPLEPSTAEPPPIPAPPSAGEDLSTKPTTQRYYRDAYPTGYGPAEAIAAFYADGADAYRALYHRLHAEVDGPIDRVRRAVTDDGSEQALLVRTSDHGELLGAHGGLHQKWYQLYDEATRVPFVIAGVGDHAPVPAVIEAMATSHVDLVPTLLDAAGIDTEAVAAALAASFTQLHPLPGRSLMNVVRDPDAVDRSHAVYLMTRDNMLEGDSGASAIARAMGLGDDAPPELRVREPADVATNVEGIVVWMHDRWWKLVRTFDDPQWWTPRNADGWRTTALDDSWELYDLSGDPAELHNHVHHGTAPDVLAALRARLDAVRAERVPARR